MTACGESSTADSPVTASTLASSTTVKSPQTTTITDPPVTTEIAPNGLAGAIDYEVVRQFEHDSGSFTQGLEFVGDLLFESAGLVGESDRRIVDPTTGEVLQEEALDPALFAEGLAERNGLLYQLTFTAGLALVADAVTLEATGETFTYEGEGWGLCTTDALPGRPLVMSNGTDQLTVRDPETFEILSTVTVVDEAGVPVALINELECVGDQVLANVWKTNDVLVIDLDGGQVVGRADFTDLVPAGVQEGRAVLNGIAYRASTDSYFVTGKLWPVMYELRLSSG
jgi:glutaminyl-peptide cyclotransferase